MTESTAPKYNMRSTGQFLFKLALMLRLLAVNRHFAEGELFVALFDLLKSLITYLVDSFELCLHQVAYL